MAATGQVVTSQQQTYTNARTSLGRFARNLVIAGSLIGVTSLVSLGVISHQVVPEYAVLVLATNTLMTAVMLLAGAALANQVKDCLTTHHNAITEKLEETLNIDDVASLAQLGPERLKVIGQRRD
jgi:hypothetical protein